MHIIGIEPEPFELGEHLIEASGMWGYKCNRTIANVWIFYINVPFFSFISFHFPLTDDICHLLKESCLLLTSYCSTSSFSKYVTLTLCIDASLCSGHRVLMFSQMTRMLDILQDYLGYRGKICTTTIDSWIHVYLNAYTMYSVCMWLIYI